MQCGGKCSTLPISPKQSEMIVTNPLSAGVVSFTLRRISFFAISPRSSPRYVFADTVVSGNEPISLQVPFEIF